MAKALMVRKNFGRIGDILPVPNLIEIQKRSFERFLQSDIPSNKIENRGLQAAFNSVFPITDYNEIASIEFIEYTVGKPKYDVRESLQKGINFAATLKIRVKLNLWEKDESGKKTLKESREQEVYLGELPLMTDTGTFIINGTERVVVSQLHRSPGIFFSHDKGRTHLGGKVLFSARIIPARGSWFDFEFDSKDILFVRIDRRKKLPATIILKALGYTDEQILKMFYPIEKIRIKGGVVSRMVSDALVG
ncbi:MAG: DNA-directed RNA polymerase subunit beta, partial [Nitrospirota bacterium]